MLIVILLGILVIPISVFGKSDPEVVTAFGSKWGEDLDNIMITVKTNKDVDQIILKSGQGEFILSPETNYGEEDLRGNNEAMDMNGDLEVDEKDNEILKKHLEGGCKDFTATVRCSHCGAADVNGDDKIDEADLKMLEEHINGKCKLEDCYFHGKQVYREETDDGFTWSFHYTPTIEGTDVMSLTPQSVTSTGKRNGEVYQLTIKAEEFKNPEILDTQIIPNQNKYLIGSSFTVYATTPLETDKVVFDYNNSVLTTDSWTSIDYEKCEKTWSQTFSANQSGIKDVTITGFGKQSNNSFIAGEPVNLTITVVDPKVLSCNTMITDVYIERWTTTSTDAGGNVITTVNERYWYTHTVTAVCNNDTDYVAFQTPNGTITDYSFSESEGNRQFSTSWVDNNNSGTASANAFATIIVYP